jgi:colanic acid biosynthesis glycosyl transferase WcaI
VRIVLLDYSGHPFQAQLSRELARRGHSVWHLYSRDFQTPKGQLVSTPKDPATLTFAPLTVGAPFQKDTFVKRRAQEQRFGELAGQQIRSIGPDVVISSNAPLDAQIRIQAAAHACGAGFIFWIQDIYSEAILRILSRKFGLLGGLIGQWYRRLEFSLLRKSEAVVAISGDFVPILCSHGVLADRITVVENWAPLDEIVSAPLSEPEDTGRPVRFLYSGTLGYKHNPTLLLKLAHTLPVEVVVHSEGPVAESLKQMAQASAVTNLAVRPWVPYHDLASTLGDADVLITIIEPDAGIFSVPSKILTYMCAGRPVLASIPLENLGARIVARENAGLVSPPLDEGAFLQNARALMSDPALRRRMAANARAYAEKAFDIEALGARFETIISDALAARPRGSRQARRTRA